jgi:ABC-type transporter MlaC component
MRNSFVITGFCPFENRYGTWKIVELNSGGVKYMSHDGNSWKTYLVDKEMPFTDAVFVALENITSK